MTGASGTAAQTTVSVGFVPRERFSLAAESLRRILANTSAEVELLVIDCALPQACSAELRQLSAGRANVRFITTANPLLPNQSRNLVLQEANGPWICLIENDVLVEPGWLEKLVATGERLAADVVSPLIMELHNERRIVHMDTAADRIEVDDAGQITILPRERSLGSDLGTEAHPVQFVELHCLLFRREVFTRIGPFDDALNTREWIDLCLALHKASCRIVLDPTVEVVFEHPSHLMPDERAFNAQAWDLEQAEQSHRSIADRWRVLNFPSSMESMIFGRRQLEQAATLNAAVRTLIPAGTIVALADYGEWAGTEMTEGLNVVPLVQQNGEAWGLPADDQDALEHLQARISEGCAYLMLASMWWKGAYPEFYMRARALYPCPIESSLINLFQLSPINKLTRNSP